MSTGIHGWKLEWISNATEPGMSDSEHELRMNQLAKVESHRIYSEHGKRVHWTTIRNGEPVGKDEEAEALERFWAGGDL